jgi:hypothetical protein
MEFQQGRPARLRKVNENSTSPHFGSPPPSQR